MALRIDENKGFRSACRVDCFFRNIMTDLKFHAFFRLPASVSLPEKFTYPFHYTPHPLCVKAAQEVQSYLASRPFGGEEPEEGKMFGVLVVRERGGDIGYLAAFSGILAGSNRRAFFVPPVYDVQQPDGFFRQEEACISRINSRIAALEESERYHGMKQELAGAEEEEKRKLEEARAEMKRAKVCRDKARRQCPTEEQLALLVRESQFQKARYKRLEREGKKRIALLRTEVEKLSAQIAEWKTERKVRSAALQQKLFTYFRLRNARGEEKDLCRIFAETEQKVPPAGSGECAAPKLLQYAYLHGMQPLAMAEFWWGKSPRNEIRRQGYFYPACKSKCGPVLAYMLQGLEVEADPLEKVAESSLEPEILYEDEWLLVAAKPAGMLSVPGKSARPSVYSYMKSRYPEAGGPLLVHRLDMATSGLLLVAKTKKVHRLLQLQFRDRTVGKRYIALLQGEVKTDSGTVDLPLCPDLSDRPRQMVNSEYGKPAFTRYEVLERRSGFTRIAFYPLTGRTHQLRVHASHPSGLDAPIVGDELYGKKADRLYLHADRLEFRHPVNDRLICVEKKADF